MRIFLARGYLLTNSMLDDIDDSDVEIIAYKPDRSGEGVEGVIISQDITSSEYTSDDIPVLLLETDGGVIRSVRGYHKILRDELTRVKPNNGDRIAIKYFGQKKTKDGKRSFHSYKVALVRASLLSSMPAVDDEPPF